MLMSSFYYIVVCMYVLLMLLKVLQLSGMVQMADLDLIKFSPAFAINEKQIEIGIHHSLQVKVSK